MQAALLQDGRGQIVGDRGEQRVPPGHGVRDCELPDRHGAFEEDAAVAGVPEEPGAPGGEEGEEIGGPHEGAQGLGALAG
uniref:Uncharacterized protein n=1 Tax=Arundo donax TaxID=35708 RepID=A0A0A9C9K9_ARUDO